MTPASSRVYQLKTCLLLAAAAAALLFVMALPISAHATDAARLTLDVENDRFASDDDRHFTQGARISYLTPSLKSDTIWGGAFDGLNAVSPFFAPGVNVSRHANYLVGQSLFTPENTRRGNPDPTDRPYAAWLYAGLGFIQDNDSRSLDQFQVLAGVVGSFAGGRQTQNDFHSFIGDDKARGWSTQLPNEPGIAVSAERIWRFHTQVSQDFEAEILPEAGATVGNIATYANLGATVRVGHNLKADYGSARIQPGFSGGSDYFNADKLSDKFGYAFYAGTEGRAVGRNIFLDGSTFESSRSVDKNTLVADFVVGASLFWSDDVKLDFIATQRTPEFQTQRGIDRFGGINLSFGI